LKILALILTLLITTALGTAAAMNKPVVTIQRYYADINRGDFQKAYSLWDSSNPGRPQSYAQFIQGFAQTAKTKVKTGTPIRNEGAMGSVYTSVPVTVDAVLKNGQHQHFRGKYVLRKVNDVPGVKADNYQWHIYSADLHRVTG